MKAGNFILVIAILACFAAGIIIGHVLKGYIIASSDTAIEEPRIISVSGSSEVKLDPDIAEFTVTASFVENSTDIARVRTADMAETVISVLEGIGIAPEDISTGYISAGPEYAWDSEELRNVVTGQRATQSIDVTVRDLSLLGKVYDSLLKLDGIDVSSATLDRSDKSSAMEEARKLALEAAMKKAEGYAEVAGVTLGKPVSIREGSGTYSPAYGIQPRMLMANAALDMSAEALPSISYRTGDITVTASVSVEYEFI